MMDTIRDDIHWCEGCHDSMGPAVLFLCLFASASCCLELGWPWLGLHDHFGSYQIYFDLFYCGSIGVLVSFLINM